MCRSLAQMLRVLSAVPVLLGSLPLRAQGPGEPPPDSGVEEPPSEEELRKAEAARHYEEAERLFESELYSAAIEQYKLAFKLFPAPAILYNIAKSYERLGDPYGCMDFFQQYLDAFKAREGRDPTDVVDVRNAIAKCRLGAKVKLRVESEPPGAAFAMTDPGKLLGQTPYETTVDPGTYTIYLDLDGYKPFKREVTVRAGEPLQLVFKLERERRSGVVEVKANIRGAAIFVDGQNIGITPYKDPIELTEGNHQITVQKDEYVPHTESLAVVVNEIYSVDAQLWLRDPPATWKGSVGWPTLVVGLGAIGAGVFAGNKANEYFQGSSDFERFAFLEKVGYAVGGTLAVTGLTLAILEALDDKAVKDADVVRAPPVRAVPVLSVGPAGAAAGVQVEF